MMDGIKRRVVFKKPNIKMPINTKERKKLNTSNVPEVPETEEIDIPDTIEIPKLQQPELHTKSGKSIIIKKEPEPKPEPKPEIIKTNQKELTFDEKFLDKINTKSRITNDNKTLEKVTKQKLKPKQKIKSKRKITKFGIISLISLVILIGWVYKTITDYLSGILDASLASIIYMISLIILIPIVLIWFITEITVKENKHEK
jgi:hypothetical protein